MGFSRQEYWSGLPFPIPGDLPNLGIEPACPTLAGGFFTTEPPRKSWHLRLIKSEDVELFEYGGQARKLYSDSCLKHVFIWLC